MSLTAGLAHEAYATAGRGPDMAERIAAFKEAGVSHLSIVPATENPAATISQLKDWVS